MITGVVSSNQRVRPWEARYTIEPGTTFTTTVGSVAYANATNVYFRDTNESDVMSASEVNGTYTDQVTTGLETGGFFKEVNGRWFFRNGTTANNMVTSSTLGGSLTTISYNATDVVWYAAASLYVLTGGTTNGVIATSPDGTTWTSRADVFTGAVGRCLATDGTRLYVVGDANNMKYTTSTTAPFTWTTVSSSLGTSDDIHWVEWLPEQSIWLATPDTSDLCAISTNGTSWSSFDLNLSGDAGNINVVWIPALNRWSAATAGINNTGATRGQAISISDTSTVSGTWTNISPNNGDNSVFFPRIHRNVYNFKNRYLVAGGKNNKLFYTRAG